MALPDDLRLRPADGADLPLIAELREAVGWSVHPWALQWLLDTEQARCLVVVDDRDRVVGVGSGIGYGSLGFVGNMVVGAGHRRRGIGSAILASVIDFLSARGAVRLELYATESGRPLYARHGFELTGPSTMVHVPRRIASPDDAVEMVDAGRDDADELTAYDAPRFGGDRGILLRAMLDDPDRPLVVARRDREIVGYGWVRRDGSRIGPLLAESPEIAVRIARDALARLPEADSLTLNLPSGNGRGAGRLAELGAALEPWDGRMARGPQIPRREETIYGNVVGALG